MALWPWGASLSFFLSFVYLFVFFEVTIVGFGGKNICGPRGDLHKTMMCLKKEKKEKEANSILKPKSRRKN